MPTVPTSTKCSSLGCPNTKARFSTYCVEHGGRDKWDSKAHNSTAERKAFNDKYNTRQWKTQRMVQLSSHPMCAKCLTEGIVTPATTVDHVFPWAQIGEHAFFTNLFQSLCTPCHTTKTHLEQRGIFRRYADTPVDYGIGDYRRIVG